MKYFLKRIALFLGRYAQEINARAPFSDRELSQMQISQENFKLLSKQLYAQTGRVEQLKDIRFGCFSQNFEDGQLLYIFSMIGEGRRTLIEMCASDGIECLGANLVINHGWRALYIDADLVSINRGMRYYNSIQKTKLQPPRFAHRWVTRENANQIIEEFGFSGEVDLLILDLDGNDFYIWESISAVNPRVVVVEYNSAWPVSGAAKVVPYDENFSLDFDPNYYIHYCGASLEAFRILGRKKGYRLIGVESKYAFNAYFMRNGIGEELFPEMDSVDAIEENPHLLAHTHRLRDNPDPGFQQRLKDVQGRDWIDLEE